MGPSFDYLLKNTKQEMYWAIKMALDGGAGIYGAAPVLFADNL